MRTSQYLLATLKEAPNDAETISHQLMIRAGMIRKLASGLYTWLPLGFRVLKKIEKIVREEMDRSGAVEILMPAVQPAELWQETGRWEKFGPQLLKIFDRHQREFCFGPTHEEVVTDLIRRELKSYKQLPLILYQIQTKFRDEIRPRFGVMRAREFLMKDGYSFHLTPESMQEGYELMYRTYSAIFTRLGLKFRSVLADTGSIGGSQSQEFHVLADSGEDEIFYSDNSNYAANRELAPTIPTEIQRNKQLPSLNKLSTPNCSSIEEVSRFLKVDPQRIMKTLLVRGKEHPVVALLLRGDHELNVIKAQKHPLVADPLTFVPSDEIQSHVGCEAGSLGPIHLSEHIPVVADYAAYAMDDFFCGANENHHHFEHAAWERDLNGQCEPADLRNVQVGDPSPDGKGTLQMARGIEVGHIFQLGLTYSQAMGATVLDENGKSCALYMGTYGIGVSRIAAAAIEQNYDDNGIIWPDAIAPFAVAIIPVNMDKSEKVAKACAELYQTLKNAGFEVLWDDRKERVGVIFADMDLIGIPHQLVISDRGLESGKIEYKHRRASEKTMVDWEGMVDFLKEKYNKHPI